MLEVEKVRPVHTVFHAMSLAVLNENNTERPEYAARLQEQGPIGVNAVIGVEKQYGQEGVRAFYTSLGTRYHPGGQPKGDPKVVKAALRECGFDEAIADRAQTDEWAADVLKSHHEGMAPVGTDVGTPIVRINGKSLFGPVITPAPKGQEAGKLFDGVALVTAADGFFELKRGIDRDPIFD